MCQQFKAKRIFALDREVFDNPKGTIYAEGMDGYYYRYLGASENDWKAEGWRVDPKSWPPRSKKGISLWRDYWRAMGAMKGSEYYDQVLEAGTIKIKSIED